VLSAAGLAAAVIGLDVVRGGQLAGTMAELAKKIDVLVCDAATEDDLAAIARATAVLPREVIWVGSAGLARHVPEALGIAGVAETEPAPAFRGSIAVIVGSRAAVAHEQVRNAGVKTIFVTPEQLRAGGAPGLDLSGDLVIAIEASRESAEDPRLSAALAEFIVPRIGEIGALVVTGGETAREVLTRVGITGLRLLREVEPGVPLAVSMGARSMPVITKSGSFGNPNTLARCVEALRQSKLE
jgi:4-hydroxythreonine-4-phosphate dehydrogenase